MNHDLQFDATQAAKLLAHLKSPEGRSKTSDDPFFVIGQLTYHVERLIAHATDDLLLTTVV